MKHYTPEFLINASKNWMKADSERIARRPAGVPRDAWRLENPIAQETEWKVKDTAFKTRPLRCLSFDMNGSPYDLWVFGTGPSGAVIERINLQSPDVEERLARYERVDLG